MVARAVAEALLPQGIFELVQSFCTQLWDSLILLSMSVAVWCDGCCLGVCFEQTDMPYNSKELGDANDADSGEYSSEERVPAELFSVTARWNKMIQLGFAVLVCSCICKLKSDLHKGTSLEVNNFTVGKIHVEIKHRSEFGWRASHSLPNSKLRFAKVSKMSPIYAIEFMAVSIMARRNIVAMCCHVFLASTVTGFPSQRNLMERNDKGAEIRVPLRGSPNLGYCAMLSIGVQYAQKICVLVDTGSYNLAVAAAPQQNLANYFNTSRVDGNFENLGRELSVTYSVGQWSGVLAKDKIAIQDVSNQSTEPVEVEFALIQHSDNFFINGALWGGILGMAYSSIGQPDSSVRSYWDILREKRAMEDVFSLSICPALGTTEQGGELILGGQFGLHSDSIYYTSIVKEEYYNVLISSITVGNHSVNINCREFNKGRTIVDSGTTDIQLAENAFNAVANTLLQYFQATLHIDIPNDFWSGQSKLAWPSDDLQFVYSEFPTIYIGFSDDKDDSQEFSLAITSQIYLQEVVGTLHERQSSYCHPKCSFFLFGIKSRSEGSVIGSTAMSGFTTIFDRENRRLGFALSTCKYPDYGDGLLPHIIGLHPRKTEDCTWSSTEWFWWISVFCICLTTCCLAIMIILKCRKVTKKQCVRISRATCCCRTYKQFHNNIEVGNSDDADEEGHDEVLSSTQPLLARVMCASPIILIKNYWKKLMYHENILSFPQQATEDGEHVSLISEDGHQDVRCSKPVEEECCSSTKNIMIVADSGPIFKDSIRSEDTGNVSMAHSKMYGSAQSEENTAQAQQSPQKNLPTHQIYLDRNSTSKTLLDDEESVILAENQAICDEELQECVSTGGGNDESLPISQLAFSRHVLQLPSTLAISGSVVTHCAADQKFHLHKLGDVYDTECSDITTQHTNNCNDLKPMESENMVETLSVGATKSWLEPSISCNTMEVLPIKAEAKPTATESSATSNLLVKHSQVQKHSKTPSDSIPSGNQTCAGSRVSDIDVTNADHPSDKLSPAKGSILDDYPKLALAEAATILEETNNDPQTSDEISPVTSLGSSDDSNNDIHDNSNITESEVSQFESTEVPKEIPRNKNALLNTLTQNSRKKKGTLCQRKSCDEWFNINQHNNSK